MKGFVKTGIVTLLSIVTLGQAHALIANAPTINASGHILMDAHSGQILAEHNADEALPPASLTKMMTSYITDYEIEQGTISLEDQVLVSVNAWRTGGSRMFIREGTRVAVGDLLKGVVIQSGNDASVALSEHIAGSEGAFANLMNQHAQRLGMTNSHFRNATGLPAEDHYSTARDMAILARAIIEDFPQYYPLYKEKSFTYNNITQQNRNLLLWRDPSVDGLKTGHTDEAGYCLVASAKQGPMRLISVVMGADSEQSRARETQKLLTWGFRFFETHHAYNGGTELSKVRVWMGKQNQVAAGLAEDLVITIPRNSKDGLQAEMTFQSQLRGPISKGQTLGTVSIRLNDEVLVERPLIALQDVEQAGFFKRLWHRFLMLFS